MNILIVEDDLFKSSEIQSLIKKSMDHVDLHIITNVSDAIIYVNAFTPNKIILDMSLPSHEPKLGEGSPLSMPAGGIELILELRSIRKVDIPIIILTQYPDIEVENEYYSIEESGSRIMSLYGITDISVVHFDNESKVRSWMKKLTFFLES